jgi:hypothetical protein
VFLECGELGSWQDFEGYHTGDEGLEECGAEEGTIARNQLERIFAITG